MYLSALCKDRFVQSTTVKAVESNIFNTMAAGTVLARSLRAARTSSLVTRRIQHQTLRLRPYSTSPSSSTDNAQPPSPEQPQTDKKPDNKLDEVQNILDKLDLGNKAVSRTNQALRNANANSLSFPSPSSSSASTSTDATKDAASMSRAMSSSIETDTHYRAPQVRRIDLKLGTKLGRQVTVDPSRGVDVAGALRILQMQLSANGVRRQAAQQKFHVRRGQVRKDIRRERWRKLFKMSFNHTVRKIQRMRAQGW